jgi:hypothetical protein
MQGYVAGSFSNDVLALGLRSRFVAVTRDISEFLTWKAVAGAPRANADLFCNAIRAYGLAIRACNTSWPPDAVGAPGASSRTAAPWIDAGADAEGHANRKCICLALTNVSRTPCWLQNMVAKRGGSG